MHFDYLLILFRHLKKHSNIAIINILSYGFGIAACLIIIGYIRYETSYDKFYDGHESVYRITLDNYYSGVHQSSTAFTFVPTASELQRKYPEVENFTVLQKRLEVVTADSLSFFETNVLVADTNYFQVFKLPLIKGSSHDVHHNDIFLAESAAKKYFGENDPVGKTLKVFRDFYTVKGVYKDLPMNTHLKFNILCLISVRESTDWNVPFMYSYVKISGDPKAFVPKLKDFSEEYSKLSDQQSEADYAFQAQLQPLRSIHLHSALLDELEVNGSADDIQILTVIAIMILVITCFNYVNLTNVINSARSKELFVRMIHGATGRHRITQYCIESLVINVFGFVIALLFLICFNEWIDPYFNFPSFGIDWASPVLYISLMGIFMIAILLSSVLPAILTSSARVGQHLNRVSTSTKENSGFARNIAFVQFVISCTLISCAIVVLKQVTLMRDGDRGFNDDGVIALKVNAISYQQNESQFVNLKNDLKANAAIEDISFSSCLPGEKLINTSVRLSADPVDNTRNCDIQVITSDYFKVYGIQIIKGRLFDEENPADVNSIVINQSLANELGRGDPESVINTEVTVDWARRPVNFTIVGIVKDYHHYSIERKIEPMLFIPLKNSFAVFRISIKNANHSDWKLTERRVQKALVTHLTEPYANRGVQVAFDAVDVKSTYLNQYGSDQQFAVFLNGLTVLAISMAGVGFFSLASTVTRRRTREVAIRKVYGAQVRDMSILISSYFLKIAALALLVSLPISYVVSTKWLNQFSSRIDIGPWFVIWPTLIAGVLTVVSISYFVLRLIFVQPIYHLRND